VTGHLFPTQEIGSLMKPAWLVKGLRGQPVPAKDRADLRAWAGRLKFTREAERVEALLDRPPGGKRDVALRNLGSVHQIRYLEAAGLDTVFDGEVHRAEMYEHPIRHSKGFTFHGHVRSFDNKYYLKASATGPARFRDAYHLDEYKFIAKHAKRPVKVPVTGPYTLADWSFTEHYLNKRAGSGRSLRARTAEARRELTLDIAAKILRPNIKALLDAGAPAVQIDEPAATTKPGEVELFVEAFNEATKGLPGKFPCHICFSDYTLLFPHVLEMKKCSEWQWELANKAASGDGYRYLDLLREYGDSRQVGLGVVDIHVDDVEAPEVVRDRILRASEVLEDPRRVLVNPDCGLRTRSPKVAFEKLQNMVAGARMAREALA